MNVKLKQRVLHSAREGKELRIPTPRCLIGRSQDCHLRPQSEAVSRRHCVLHVRNDRVFVRDLKSRTGTFVNGQRVQEECELESGDMLQIGPLTFELHIDHTMADEQRAPRVLGKLPPRPEEDSEDSSEAAEHALMKYLHRRSY